MTRVAVYCGAHRGARPEFAAAAADLGRALGRRGLGLVFGGGGVGLMGAVADAALEAGAGVIGVLPEALMTRELAHPRVADLRVVPSMHARKALMADLADAFVALPGGFGTLDEAFEVITWLQLGFHRKPFGFLNVAGFFDPLLRFVDRCVAEEFVRAESAATLLVESRVDALLDRLSEHRPESALQSFTRKTA